MLILPIKKKWFDMIASGEKKEEYREIKPYYDSRFMNAFGFLLVGGQMVYGEAATEEIRKELKEGRKISDSRLKSLKEVSRSMKESARMIDSVISEASGKKGMPISRRKPPRSRKAGNIEIIF